MSIDLNKLSNPGIRALLERVDKMDSANKNNRVDKREAAEAARRIATYKHWQDGAMEAFGVVPRSGAELMRFASNPPKDAAESRILGHSYIAGIAERAAAGRGQETRLGAAPGGRGSSREIAITPGGRFSLNGRLPKDLNELSRTLYDAAKMTDAFKPADLSETVQRRLFGTLSDALQISQTGRRTRSKERLFSSAMTLSLKMAREIDPKTQKTLHSGLLDRSLQALAHEKDPELKMFYLNEMSDLTTSMDPVQKAAFHAIKGMTLPKAPPVEEYTAGRTRPLVVEHTIHEEFWDDEIKFYEGADWKLVSKDKHDHERVYEGLLKDPEGNHPPLKVHTTVRKGELDFLSGMSDPDVHTIIYSGHSALGGNGSQAIHDAEDAQGLPKTVLISNCRGQDNYSEFSNKFPEAMLIATRDPTYSDSGQARVRGLYDIMKRGESFETMRKNTWVRFYDEKADNYIYPDEMRRFRYMDLDQDGKMERSELQTDRLFDVEGRRNLADFNRAIAFTNTELFYHWELPHEEGKGAAFGRNYFDHIIPDGALTDPKPGELLRLEVEERPRAGTTPEKFFRIKCDPKDLGENRDIYAGQVTAQVMMELAKERTGGKLNIHEAMRGVLAGAQAVYYLDVYTDTAEQSMRDYLDSMGLHQVSPQDIDKIFHDYDSHANNPQVEAFIDLLKTKRGVDLDAWKPPSY